MHVLELDHLILQISMSILVIASIVILRNLLLDLLKTSIGTISFFLGNKSKYSFKLFWFLKPRLIEIDSFEKLQKKTARELKRSHLHDFIDNIETGDLFTFVGHIDKPYQVAIKWYTSSPVSHVGICYKKEEQLYFVEATSKGFKVSDLHQTLHRYYLKFPIVVYRKLHATRDEQFYQNFDTFVEEYRNREYTPMTSLSGIMELMRSAIDLRMPLLDRDLFKNKRDVDTLFCSELVAEAYEMLGLINLDQEVPSNEFTPADFSRINEDYSWGPERHKVENLLGDAYLDDDIYVYTKVSRAELEGIYGVEIKGPKEEVNKPPTLFSD